MAPPGHFRAFERQSLQLSATLRREESGPTLAARTINLGIGGLCLELDPGTPSTPSHPSPRAEVIVEISAPSLWDPLVLRGEVIWEQPSPTRGRVRLGVRFAHEMGAPLAALFEILNTHGFE